MKLRNLLFGTMIACAFAACSNEDDPIPNVDPTPEAGTATASLTVSVKNSVRKVTKAETVKDCKQQMRQRSILYLSLCMIMLLER